MFLAITKCGGATRTFIRVEAEMYLPTAEKKTCPVTCFNFFCAQLAEIVVAGSELRY